MQGRKTKRNRTNREENREKILKKYRREIEEIDNKE